MLCIMEKTQYEALWLQLNFLLSCTLVNQLQVKNLFFNNNHNTLINV